MTRSAYGYAENDPLNGSDPSGLSTCGKPKSIWDSVGSLVDCASKGDGAGAAHTVASDAGHVKHAAAQVQEAADVFTVFATGAAAETGFDPIVDLLPLGGAAVSEIAGKVELVSTCVEALGGTGGFHAGVGECGAAITVDMLTAGFGDYLDDGGTLTLILHGAD